MKVAIVGNDLRSIVMAHIVRREGGQDVLVPGPDSFKSKLNYCKTNIGFEGQYKNWERMRLKRSIVDAVVSEQPDFVVCLHVESSDAGVVEVLRDAGRTFGKWSVFGVEKECSVLETSKSAGLQFASNAGLNIPATEVIEVAERKKWETEFSKREFRPIVLKADGLAGGRGTHIVKQRVEIPSALEALNGQRIICQEYIEGTEFAISLLCGAHECEFVDLNFEYKRALDGDQGPNTPGMGSLSYALSGHLKSRYPFGHLANALIEKKYSGPLDASFIMEPSGRIVFLEFTTRFGDPELCVQATMRPRLTAALWNIANGRRIELAKANYNWAGCLIARGPTNDVENTSTFSDASFEISDSENTEACFVTTGADYMACQEGLTSIAKFIPKNLKFRNDIGYDIESRFRNSVACLILHGLEITS